MNLILAFASLFDLLVAYTIFFDTKLSAHPAYLVGLISLADGFFNNLGVNRLNLCQYDFFIDLFSKTVFFNN